MENAPTKSCLDCSLPKGLDEFYNSSSNADGKQLYCKSCHNLRNRRAAQEKRRFVWAYTASVGCVDCDERDPAALDLDHVTGNKTLEVSVMVSRGWSLERIRKEIEKCVVRCANCHRKKTAKERGYGKQDALLVPRRGRHPPRRSKVRATSEAR